MSEKAVTSPVRWVRPRLERETMRELVSKSFVRPGLSLLARLIIQGSLIAFAFLLLMNGDVVFGLAVAWVSCSLWNFMGYGGLGHELFHGTVFPSKKINQRLFVLASILTWNNFGYFEYSHWVHHKWTLYPGDPEGQSEAIPKKNLPALLFIDILGLGRRIRILARNALGRIPANADSIAPMSSVQRRRVVFGARVVLLVQGSMLLLFLLSGMFWLFLLVTLAPFTATLFSRCLETAQHSGMARSVPDFRLNTRSFVLSKLWSFLYTNMNLHIEHHLYPAVPYYRLPELRNELVQQQFLAPIPRSSIWRVLQVSLRQTAEADLAVPTPKVESPDLRHSLSLGYQSIEARQE